MGKPRTELEEPTELTDFSASRLGLAGKCGRAFEYKYVRKIPDPYESSSALFGNVIHDGVEEWYGPDGEPNDHTQTDLVPLVLAQWENQLANRAPEIWRRMLELRDLDEECKNVAAAILFKRPQLKQPTSTQEYLTSQAVRDFQERRLAMREFCDKLPDLKWKKDEDPFTAYQKTAVIAAQMERRWKHLPRPVAVERPFAIEIAGYRVRGRIDQVRVDPHRQTGIAVVRVIDIKTAVQPLTPMEAILQFFIYSEAAREDPTLPNTDEIAVYLARHDKYQQGTIDRERHLRLASRILRQRAEEIEARQFQPSYGFWCKQCDFRDLCESEISLWQGDGLVVDLLDT